MGKRRPLAVVIALEHQVRALVFQLVVEQGQQRQNPAAAQAGDIHRGKIPFQHVSGLDQQLPGRADFALQFRGGGRLAPGQSKRVRGYSRVLIK